MTSVRPQQKSRHAGLPRWAEQERELVITATLRAARRILASLTDDPDMLSYQLWSFLSASRVDEAWVIFENVVIKNRFEMWRTVVIATIQKTQAKQNQLKDAVMMPNKVKDTKNPNKSLVEWDAICCEYLEAGIQKVRRSTRCAASQVPRKNMLAEIRRHTAPQAPIPE